MTGEADDIFSGKKMARPGEPFFPKGALGALGRFCLMGPPMWFLTYFLIIWFTNYQ